MQSIKITHTNKKITVKVIKNTINVNREGIYQKMYKEIQLDRCWKEKNKEYLRELQNFLDKADNIDDESLKQKVIAQMLKCDDKLTKLAEIEFKKIYKLGYMDAKDE